MAFDLSKFQPAHVTDHPITGLQRDDLDLILQLVLRSGSLKELAEAYGVSYPTIRARLDRVIERLRGLVEGRKPDAVNELLATLVERNELSPGAARAIRDVVRAQAAEARVSAVSLSGRGE